MFRDEDATVKDLLISFLIFFMGYGMVIGSLRIMKNNHVSDILDATQQRIDYEHGR